jgi:hypothetical protein
MARIVIGSPNLTQPLLLYPDSGSMNATVILKPQEKVQFFHGYIKSIIKYVIH